jgi:hypothetical protein
MLHAMGKAGIRRPLHARRVVGDDDGYATAADALCAIDPWAVVDLI